MRNHWLLGTREYCRQQAVQRWDRGVGPNKRQFMVGFTDEEKEDCSVIIENQSHYCKSSDYPLFKWASVSIAVRLFRNLPAGKLRGESVWLYDNAVRHRTTYCYKGLQTKLVKPDYVNCYLALDAHAEAMDETLQALIKELKAVPGTITLCGFMLCDDNETLLMEYVAEDKDEQGYYK